MNSTLTKLRHFTVLALACVFASSCLLLSAVISQTAAQTNSSMGTGYATPQAAVDALTTAAEKFDEKTLETILGPNSYDIIHTGEPVRDKEMSIEFASPARAKQSLTKDSGKPG